VLDVSLVVAGCNDMIGRSKSIHVNGSQLAASLYILEWISDISSHKWLDPVWGLAC
jgi:predicted small secreted protein